MIIPMITRTAMGIITITTMITPTAMGIITITTMITLPLLLSSGF
jgi:hypothetical protein